MIKEMMDDYRHDGWGYVIFALVLLIMVVW